MLEAVTKQLIGIVRDFVNYCSSERSRWNKTGWLSRKGEKRNGDFEDYDQFMGTTVGDEKDNISG